MESKLTRSMLIAFVLLLVAISVPASLQALSGAPAPSSALPSITTSVTSSSAISQNVELVGQIGGPTYAVAVQDHYAYVGVGAKLAVLDISDPTNPIVMGQTGALPETPMRVVVSGVYAYIADGNSGLRIINVADPMRPAEIGFYDTPGIANDVVVSGTFAYLADDFYGLRIVDVSDPTHPREVGAWSGTALCVALAGSYAYVGTWDGMHVIDVSNPASPQHTGFIGTIRGVFGLAAAGHYAYAGTPRNAGDYHKGLWIIDVSDPTQSSSNWPF